MIKHSPLYNRLAPQVIDLLSSWECPYATTVKLGRQIYGHMFDTLDRDYRPLLRVLNQMEDEKILFSSSDRGGAFWMLRARDIRVSYPDLAKGILDGDIPF